MTDHLRTLRLLHSFAQGDHREALEAAIEALEAQKRATIEQAATPENVRPVAQPVEEVEHGDGSTGGPGPH